MDFLCFSANIHPVFFRIGLAGPLHGLANQEVLGFLSKVNSINHFRKPFCFHTSKWWPFTYIIRQWLFTTQPRGKNSINWQDFWPISNLRLVMTFLKSWSCLFAGDQGHWLGCHWWPTQGLRLGSPEVRTGCARIRPRCPQENRSQVHFTLIRRPSHFLLLTWLQSPK